MTRYRLRAVLLLFLLLHLTACMTTRSQTIPIPIESIEATQLELVLVTRSDGTQLEVENPSVVPQCRHRHHAGCVAQRSVSVDPPLLNIPEREK